MLPKVTAAGAVLTRGLKKGVFLKAEWRDVAMVNYLVDPELLESRVPPGTELDFFENQTFVSLVGFRFLNTEIRGVRVPFHTDFEEVNLRFYVRRGEGENVRRGVAFIREIVPRYAIAKVAQLAYNENYICLPMSHEIRADRDTGEVAAEYRWRWDAEWNHLVVVGSGWADYPEEGTLEHFIAEHYWGYSSQPYEGCLEYEVEHVPWRVRNASFVQVLGDMTAVYGEELGRVLRGEPHSAFLADGSAMIVYRGCRIC